MTTTKRIAEISVSGLQGMFNYKIDFAGDGNTAILIAPNGYGKTAFLAVINTCLQFRLKDAAEQQFSKLVVTFEDKTRWSFERVPFSEEQPEDYASERAWRLHLRSRRNRSHRIKFTKFDARGRAKKAEGFGNFDKIPREVLMRALDRNLPVDRISHDRFRDLQEGDSIGSEALIERYHDRLYSDYEFRLQLGAYAQDILDGGEAKHNCVFIETQRLLQAKRVTRPDGEASSVQQEEILRQAEYLASLLERTYGTYAATSQALDRSFPNRLVNRSQLPVSFDLQKLRDDLDAIEARRRALTEAGILDETSEPLVAPKDEFAENIAVALAIYVEDSREKLSTFDDVFSKVSAFRDLLSKKIRPKTLTINRSSGAEIRRDSYLVDLDKLSSGEKHEFIMLFRLIFETPPLSLVLIDEPEISLHVSWQLEFMSDLNRIQSANSFQSIIATHSPQIVQGENDITFDLSEQVG